MKQVPGHAIGTGPLIDNLLTGKMEAHPVEPPGHISSDLKGFIGPCVSLELTYYITKI